jgi:hypothetical protein
LFAIMRARNRSCVFLDPAHAEKQRAREPETSRAPRPAREGGRSAKVPSHKADAHALEESDCVIVSMNQTNKEERSSAGVWGEKGVGHGEHRFIPHLPDTARGTRVCQGWSGVRGATLLVIHLRREPYAGKPLVRFCAGGDQRWSSLPQHLGPSRYSDLGNIFKVCKIP